METFGRTSNNYEGNEGEIQTLMFKCFIQHRIRLSLTGLSRTGPVYDWSVSDWTASTLSLACLGQL
jgi:hypothetical protein